VLVAVIAAWIPAFTSEALSAPSVSRIGHAGRWITDAAGRVIVVQGLNMVYKVRPYYPAAAGFGADDAAFLQLVVVRPAEEDIPAELLDGQGWWPRAVRDRRDHPGLDPAVHLRTTVRRARPGRRDHLPARSIRPRNRGLQRGAEDLGSGAAIRTRPPVVPLPEGLSGQSLTGLGP
jgi:hypothetical protein